MPTLSSLSILHERKSVIQNSNYEAAHSSQINLNKKYEGNMIEVSSVVDFSPQNSTVESLVHYRNIFANPENFIKRKFNYSQMKVFNEKFRKVSERLKTFEEFPKTLTHLVKPLAVSGFYFIGNKDSPDKVKCIYCQGILVNWKKTDIPNVEHKKHYATCPFLLNFNVGNENCKLEADRNAKFDPDLKEFNGKIPYVVVRPHVDIVLLNNIDMMDIDSRLETFRNHQYVKDYSFHGLFVDLIDNKEFIKCCECHKSIELLKHIEKLPLTIFHLSHCKYLNSDYADSLMISDNNYKSCIIEFAITDSEIESRMDLIKINDMNIDQDKMKRIIATKLKSTGEDYESTYELLHDMKNFKEITSEKTETDILEMVLSEYSCVVCLDKPIEVIFLPCGHWKTCYSCSSLLTNCPVCRLSIVKRVRGISFHSDM